MNFTRTIGHVHVESDNDAYQEPKRFFDRLEELGIEAVAVTDHGALNSFYDLWDENKSRGNKINIIYGCEMYVRSPRYDQDEKTAHMIIMAKDMRGKQGIDKLTYICEKNQNSKGFPVVTFEMLESLFGKDAPYKDSCFFTTACIAGLPSLELLANDNTERKLSKLSARLEKAISQGKALNPEAASVESIRNKCFETESRIKELQEENTECKAAASKKTVALEKREQTAIKNGFDDKAAELHEQIQEIKHLAEKSKIRSQEIAKELSAKKAILKTLKFEAKKIGEAVDKFTSLKSEIDSLEKALLPKESLYKNARAILEQVISIVGKDNLFVEIQYHGLSAEKYCYSQLISLARELGLPLVAANDAHMTNGSEDDIIRRKVMKYLRYNTIFEDTEEQIEAEKEYYLKAPEQLREWLLRVFPAEAVDEALDNMNRIGSICKVEPIYEDHYPVFDKTIDADQTLREMAYAGIEKRFPGKKGWTEEYAKRLEYELDVIKKMGYSNYHLIVADLIRYGKSIGYVGPGRGSAAGSLVCYLVEITEVDPIKYELLFERFLNPERASMPDIDIDFAPSIRQQVIHYTEEKYGKKAVVSILTKSYQQTKGAIRDAASYLGATEGDSKKYLSLGNAIRKNVPDTLGIKFDSTMPRSKETVYEYLLDVYENDPSSREILRIAYAIEGCFYGYGVHAAGIVISPSDITDYMPVRWNPSTNSYTTCCTKEQVEEAGFLKMDYLGLKNLDQISETVSLIEKNHGVTVDPFHLPIDENVIYEIAGKGRTIGVFQLEKDGMRKFMKELAPSVLEDLFIGIALYRPGPFQYIPAVVKAKHGREPITYLTDKLRPYLEKTYGAMIFQEQVMRICQNLAGFSLGRADTVRKYMAKKKADKLAGEREAFVEGCVSNVIERSIAEELFSQMEEFGKYAFNRSHSVAYGMLSYATCWLKYHYPAEFFCALLNRTEKTSEYLGIIKDAREFGVPVLPPDINHSKQDFSVYNNKILFGLGSIKGVKSGAEAIIRNRLTGGPYKDYKDFVLRSGASDSVDLALIRSGAFDGMGYSRISVVSYCRDMIHQAAKALSDAEASLKDLDEVIEFAKSHTDITESEIFSEELSKALPGNSFKTPKKCPTVDSLMKKRNTLSDKRDTARANLSDIQIRHIAPDKKSDLNFEKTLLGTYLSGHPTDGYVSGAPISDTDMDTKCITGVITSVEIKLNKNKQEWAIITIEDRTAEFRAVCFAAQFSKLKDLLVENAVVTLHGTVKEDDFNSSEENIVYTMTIDYAEEAKKEAAGSYVIPMKDMTEFHGRVDELREMESPTGVPVWVYFTEQAKFSRLKTQLDEGKLINAGAITM